MKGGLVLNILIGLLAVMGDGLIEVQAAESAPFSIDTEGVEDLGLSGFFEVDTTVDDSLEGSWLSSAFTIDTQEDDLLFLAGYSSPSKIDTRTLTQKYDLWVGENVPEGMRGRQEVTALFGVPNLWAFAQGWEKDQPSYWYQAEISEVVSTGDELGVWLRVHRRNDLPELIWTWRSSENLMSFPSGVTVLESFQNPSDVGGDGFLGEVMEQWDVRVPFSADQNKKFYQLEISDETDD